MNAIKSIVPFLNLQQEQCLKVYGCDQAVTYIKLKLYKSRFQILNFLATSELNNNCSTFLKRKKIQRSSQVALFYRNLITL